MRLLEFVSNERLLDKSDEELADLRGVGAGGGQTRRDDSTLDSAVTDGGLYRRSTARVGDALVCMALLSAGESEATAVTGPYGGGLQKRLLVVSRKRADIGFYGPVREVHGLYVQEVVPGVLNLGPLWHHLPWTKPVSLREQRATFGMGDRTGMATAGQIRAARRFDVSPVLAQQSIRELDFTARSFGDVVADTAFQVFQEGFRRGYGADGDHLKTIPDIDRALAFGMPMVTLDLTEVMRPEVADWSDDAVAAAFASLPAEFRERVSRDYAEKTISLESTSVTLDGPTARRCAVMYGDALAFTGEVNGHLNRRTGGAYDLEISVDETTTPTLPSHHYFISRELERRGVTVSSLAPRFIGEFQKAIDYIGEIPEFTEQFRIHAEIARATGGYKVSVHSGSDKFSVYPIVGEETNLRLHLKTSGTSWLESLRTIAQQDPGFYRFIHQKAFDYFPQALKAYHITADLNTIAPLEKATDEELPSYLDHPACRQLLHISYGGLLRDPEVRERYFPALLTHETAHHANLEKHMGRHLELLGVPKA